MDSSNDKIYNIYTTEEFDRDFEKLDYSIQKQIETIFEKLEINPYASKPLGYEFFREKKVQNYRIYYLIYDDYVAVFVIAISDKKDQQGVIDKIKSLIPSYKDEIKRKINEN
ncbi:MAG: type II toxin-antitoxin system RelE/ParE family toxin [Nanoarchaeota archaeon]